MKCDLISERPEAGESLHGYALRTSESNGYDRISWIVELIGGEVISQGGLLRLQGCIGSLSELTGVDKTRLWTMGYERLSGNSLSYSGFGDQEFHRSLLDVRRPKICPQCLEEGMFIRKAWDLTLATSCPTHHTKMVYDCHECGRPISWARSSVGFCECGADYREAGVEQASDDEVLASHYLHSKISGTIPKGAQKFNSHVSKMELHEFGTGTVFIGWLVGLLLSPDLRSLAKLTPEERSRLMQTVGQVFSEWPSSYYKLLDMKRVQTKPKEHGFNALFSDNLYRRLFDSKAQGLKVFQDEFARYAEDRRLGRFTSRRGNPRVMNGVSSDYYSAEEARKFMGIGKDRLQWLVETGRLHADVNEPGMQKVYRFHPGDLVQAQKFIEGLCGVKDVSSRLGVSIPLASQMLEHGVLKAVRGPCIDGFRNWQVEGAEIDAYLSELQGRAKSVTGASAELRTIKQTIARLRRYGCEAVEIIRAVSDGRVEIYEGEDGADIGNLRVSRAEIMRALGIQDIA